jgi:hypothetical protein
MKGSNAFVGSTSLGCVFFVSAIVMPAYGFDFSPVRPMNVNEVDPAMLSDIYGAWEIRDKTGRKRCRVVLSKETTIGGNAIEVAPGCAKLFPVMADISAWRLQESWIIDLADPLRKTRLRFSTPDNRYIAQGDARDVGDIDELRKLPDAKPAKRK